MRILDHTLSQFIDDLKKKRWHLTKKSSSNARIHSCVVFIFSGFSSQSLIFVFIFEEIAQKNNIWHQWWNPCSNKRLFWWPRQISLFGGSRKLENRCQKCMVCTFFSGKQCFIQKVTNLSTQPRMEYLTIRIRRKLSQNYSFKENIYLDKESSLWNYELLHLTENLHN